MAHSNMKLLQGFLLLKKAVPGFGQEQTTQQAFLFQEMIQCYFQAFLYVLEINWVESDLKVAQLFLLPLIHLGLN